MLLAVKLILRKLSKMAVDQDAFFNANQDSFSSFVPAPVVTTQQQPRRGRNGGRRRNQNRNGRRRNGNGNGSRRNQRQFQQVSNSFVI